MDLIFHNTKEVGDFVGRVEKYPFHMDLFRGSIVVDANSFLGVLNMGLNRIIRLKVYAEDYEDMYQDIKQFIVSQ